MCHSSIFSSTSFQQAFGNHEFTLGPDVLANFLKKTKPTFQAVCANLDVSEESPLDGLYSSSITKTIGGEEIGIVGYTTQKVNEISNVGKLENTRMIIVRKVYLQ